MATNGKRSLEILGVMQYTADPYKSPKGQNTDNGISIDFNGKATQQEEILSNVYKTREQKNSVFELMQKLNQSNTSIGSEITDALYNVDISETIYKKDTYSRKEILEYKRRMDNIKKGNGAIYSLDIETMGEHPTLGSMNSGSKGSSVNKRHYAMTEVSIWKSYQDNEGKWVREKVKNFTSSPSSISIKDLLETKDADQTTNITLQRIAGYSGSDSIDPVTGEVLKWLPGMDTTDTKVLKSGALNVMKNTQYTRAAKGSREYKAYRSAFKENVLDVIKSISEEENSVLTTMNGLGFDLPQIMAEMNYLGLNEGGEYDNLFKNHYDNQVIQAQFIAEKKFEKARKYGVRESLSLEEQGKVIKKENPEIEKEIESLFGTKEVPHMASYDTYMTTVETLNTFNEAEEELGKYVDTSLSKLNIDDDSILVANSAFVSKDSSLHFKVNNGEINDYNSVVISRDTPYKIKTFGIKSKDEITKAIGDNAPTDVIDNIENKVMVELTNALDEDEKVYMFYNDMEGVQKDLIDSELLELNKIDNNKLNVLKKSLEEKRTDATRRDLEGFGSTSSWKKSDKLEKFVNQYESLQDYQIEGLGRGLNKDELETLLSGKNLQIDTPKGVKELLPNEVLQGLTIQKEINGGIQDVIPKETLALFKDLYPDLEKNSGLYRSLLDGIKNKVGDNYIVSHENNSTYDRMKNNLIVDDVTSSFGGAMNEIESTILENTSELEKARYIINGDSFTKEKYKELISEKKIEEFKGAKFNPEQFNNYSVPEDEEMKIIKSLFKKRYREDYDIESETAKNLLKDRKAITGRSYATSIDILGSDGEYRNLPFKNKKSFRNGLSKSVYSLDYNNKNTNLKRHRQMQYLDEVAMDLHSRGLISNENVLELADSSDIGAKIKLLSTELFGNKKKADKIISKAVTNTGTKKTNKVVDALSSGYNGVKNIYDPSKVSDEDFDIVKPFIDNRIMVDKYTGKENVLMGKSYSEHLDILEKAKKISRNEVIERVVATNSTNFAFVGSSRGIGNDKMDAMFGQMYKDLGWSESNVQSFEKLIRSKDFNKGVTLKGSDKEVGLDKFFVRENGDYKMVMTTNRDYIREQMTAGVPLDDLKDKALIYKLPKVEEKLGIKYISQSETHKKLVSNDIVPTVNKGSDVISYVQKDTVDQVLDSLNGDFKWATKHIEDKNYNRANQRIGLGWRNINETKSLTGISDVYKLNDSGKLVVDTVFSPNRGDFAKTELVNYTPLIYDLDTATTIDPKLRKKLDKLVGEDNATYLLNKVIPGMKDKVKNGGTPVKEMTEIFSYGVDINKFMADNLKDISSALLSDEGFVKRASGNDTQRGIIQYLKDMSEYGDFAVLGKESDVYRGYGSKVGIHDLVPFSDVSGTARNVQFQSLNGYSIPEESLLAATSSKIGSNSSIEDVYKHLGIKPNLGVNTSKGLEFAHGKYKDDGSLIGFSAKMKHMTPKEFNDKVKQVYHDGVISDEWMKKLASDGIEDVTKEEIQKVAKLISQSSGLYEDDGMINIALAEVLNPRTVTREKVHTPSKNLRLGQTIKAGDLIGHDNKGKPVIYDKDNAVVRNVKEGKLYLQLNENYNNIKLNIGGSEKAVFSAPNISTDKGINARMKKIISAVQYHVSDGANLVANPGVRKHTATNTMLIPSINAIAESIANDSDVNLIRQTFKDMVGSSDIDFKFDNKRNGYIAIHNPSLKPHSGGADPVKEINNAIDHLLSNTTGDLQDRLKKNFNTLDNNKVGWMDVFLSSNNTIERGMGADGIGSGVSLSTRGHVVAGTTRVLDEGVMAEYSGTIFPNLLKDEARMIIEGNQDKAMQANNIFAAYALNAGEENLENVRVKKVKLQDIVNATGQVEADDLDEIFKFEANGKNRYNVYEIDLEGLDVGLKLDNQFYVNEGKTAAQNSKFGTQLARKKVDKIYVPAIVPNYHEGNAMLNKTQKSMSELIFSLQNLMNKEQNGMSLGYSHELANRKMSKLLDQMEHDIFSKDGLRVQAQKTKKNPGTFRVESQKVIPPILDKDGMLEDLAFGHLVTKKDANGKVKYTKSMFVNKESLERVGLDFDMLGYDIMKMQVADESEQVNFLKGYVKNLGMETSKTELKDVQEYVRGLELDGHLKANDLAERFMEDIGIDSAVSRDPIIRTESFNGARLRIAEGVQVGGIVVDSVTADGMKLDSDGDKINVMLKSFFSDKDNNVLRVKDYSDSIRKELRVDASYTSDHSMRRVKDMSEKLGEYSKENQNIFDRELFYNKVINSESGIGASGDLNFLTNDIARQTANRANISKRIIGETSDPGLYIRRAASEYRHSLSKKDVSLAKAYSKSIDIGTLITEQKAIDYKLSDYTEEALAKIDEQLARATKMEQTWGDMFNATRELASNKSVMHNKSAQDKLKQSIVSAIEMVKPYATKDLTSVGMVFENQKHDSIEDINAIAEKIMKGQVTRHKDDNVVHIEEFLYDLLNTFEDDKSAEVYKSVLTRQSKRALGLTDFKTDRVDRLQAMINSRNASEAYKSHANNIAALQFSDTFLANEVVLDNTELIDGSLVQLKKFGNIADAGIYKVQNLEYESEKAISLIDVSNGKAHKFSGQTVFDIRERLNEHGAVPLNSTKSVGEALDETLKLSREKISKDILTDRGSYIRARNEAFKGAKAEVASAYQTASIDVLKEYDVTSLDDIHNTLEGLRIKGYNVDNKSVLQEMNEHLKLKGTKDYQENKRKILMKQNDLVAKGVVSKPGYNQLMKDIDNTVEDFTSIKTFLSNSQRTNIDSLSGSVDLSSHIESVISIEDKAKDMTLQSLDRVRLAGAKEARGIFEERDKQIYEKVSDVFQKYQDNEKFREEVLGWELDKVKEYLKVGETDQAIRSLNDSVLIYSQDHSGKKLGQLSLDQLREVRSIGNETGIKPEIVRMNNEIIDELISLRQNHDIMIDEVTAPIIDNYKDGIAEAMRKQMQDEIKRKGATRTKTTSSTASMKDALDKFKGKVSGMSSKQKMMAGAVAVAGLGATAMIGAQANKSRVELKKANEDEQLIQARSATGQAPPSDKRIYTSDSNAINVNVRGRSPIRGAADGAERAIASLFGHNVSVNSNIQDDRRDISDRDVDMAMEKAIR